MSFTKNLENIMTLIYLLEESTLFFYDLVTHWPETQQTGLTSRTDSSVSLAVSCSSRVETTNFYHLLGL